MIQCKVFALFGAHVTAEKNQCRASSCWENKIAPKQLKDVGPQTVNLQCCCTDAWAPSLENMKEISSAIAYDWALECAHVLVGHHVIGGIPPSTALAHWNYSFARAVLTC